MPSPSATSVATALSERELAAWRGLLRGHAALVKALDAELEQEHGLPLTSYEVLLYLEHAEDGRMRMCDLAESVLLSRSGLTRLIDRLERNDLVMRRSCEQDARGAYAELTDAGREKFAAAQTTHLAGIREHFLGRFSSAELELMASFWDRLSPGSSTTPCGE